MKTNFTINLWDFVAVEEINNALDEHLQNKFMPVDIGYKVKTAKSNGDIQLEADFTKEEI